MRVLVYLESADARGGIEVFAERHAAHRESFRVGGETELCAMCAAQSNALSGAVAI